MNITIATERFKIFLDNNYQTICIVIGFSWLVMLSSLMITDVWDETNALIILSTEPILSMGILKSVQTIWLQELPLDIYRPIGSSLFMIFGKISAGNYVFLRYVNAAFVLGAAYIFASALRKNTEDTVRAIMFYIVVLFSSSALITAGWFANIFDASCLFFLAVATSSHGSKNYVVCTVAMVLAIFSKEIYVLAIPFLFLAMVEAKDRNKKAIAQVAITIAGFSVFYWFLRQAVVPLGSNADIHGFSADAFSRSALSFLSGFWFQFSKFSPYSPLLWIGLTVLIISIFAVRSAKSKLTIITLLLMSTVIYWEMFSFQGNEIITSHNFVGRLYLVPFVLIFYLVCKDARGKSILLVSVLSIWGMVVTYQDHTSFQNTYLQIYELADDAGAQIRVHYPEKLLIDPRRNLLIGDYPDSPIRINVELSGLD